MKPNARARAGGDANGLEDKADEMVPLKGERYKEPWPATFAAVQPAD